MTFLWKHRKPQNKLIVLTWERTKFSNYFILYFSFEDEVVCKCLKIKSLWKSHNHHLAFGDGVGGSEWIKTEVEMLFRYIWKRKIYSTKKNPQQSNFSKCQFHRREKCAISPFSIATNPIWGWFPSKKNPVKGWKFLAVE